MNLSEVVNGRLLPELRELDIPCPYTTRSTLHVSTEYHKFIVHTFKSSELLLSAVIGADHIDLSFYCEKLEAHHAARLDEELKLPLADPDLFSRAMAIIADRWTIMRYYEDLRLLSYIEQHSQSDRALFNHEHINRLLELAGHEPIEEIACPSSPFLGWMRLPYTEAIKYIERARHKLGVATVSVEREQRP